MNDETLVYNEQAQAFTGIYDIDPNGAIVFPSNILLCKSQDGLYKWNSKTFNDETLVYTVSGFQYFNDKKQLTPELKYVVNSNSLYTKVFDNSEFGGRLYGGDDLNDITFKFNTPLKQHGELSGGDINNREYNFTFAIPRNGNAEYGDRLRGKTMQVELSSKSNDYDFSLQYIATKYRISWT